MHRDGQVRMKLEKLRIIVEILSAKNTLTPVHSTAEERKLFWQRRDRVGHNLARDSVSHDADPISMFNLTTRAGDDL